MPQSGILAAFRQMFRLNIYALDRGQEVPIDHMEPERRAVINDVHDEHVCLEPSSCRRSEGGAGSQAVVAYLDQFRLLSFSR